jgi:hypothetical protein
MWETGSFPSLTIYEQLKPIIAYVHFKGGRCESPQGPLKWRSSLADASWPVAEIATQVIIDGVSPVICINPSHGGCQDETAGDHTEDDIDFLRSIIQATNR